MGCEMFRIVNFPRNKTLSDMGINEYHQFFLKGNRIEAVLPMYVNVDFPIISLQCPVRGLSVRENLPCNIVRFNLIFHPNVKRLTLWSYLLQKSC